ncbi:sugar ABC transporter ATP-binding protein [Patulibacter sp. S7RM1-6]
MQVAMTLLAVEGVSKQYPGTRALDGVDLQVDAGEVHAVLGQNGAGKSTLMRSIAGSVRPDTGTVTLDGRPVPLGSPLAAREAGIGIVYQELSLVPQRSIAENVLSGRWPTRAGLVDGRAMERRAGEVLRRVGLDLDPRTPVSRLGMASRQLVEIAKALSTDPRVLLLDEPTSALSDREAQRLFEIVRSITADGVAVIYVSHRLKELVQITDRISVLRDGRLVETVRTADVDEHHLAEMMVGRRLDDAPAASTVRAEDDHEVVLRAEGLACAPRLKPTDLQLRAGEIVTVFGLVGAGRTRLARTLFGLDQATEGTVEVLGDRVRIRSPRDAIAARMGFVGEDRGAGLVKGLSIAANITMASHERVSRGSFLRFGEERRAAEQYQRELSIRCASVEQPVGSLSGGNQQKVLLARWMCSGARVLVLDDPTKGIDVGAKEEVFDLLRRLAADGVAVLYLTSELKEARTFGDRVLVMAGGAITATLTAEASDDQIMMAAGGVVHAE